MSQMASWSMYLVAFGSGFAIMSIEIAGARVMAPVFGLSAIPWTAIIGIVLTFLAIGNYLGGCLSDAGRIRISSILAASAGAAMLPVVGRGIPRMAMDAYGFIGGALISATVLFALPALALGTVVPYLIRAGATSLHTVGRQAGSVSAAATLGSICGTFLTGFVLIPLVELRILLTGIALGLLLLSAVSTSRVGGRGSLLGICVAAALAISVGFRPVTQDGTVLYAGESLQGSLQVTVDRGPDGRLVRQLRQNGGTESGEYIDTGRSPYAYVRATLRLLESLPSPAGSILILGGAALTLPVEIAGQAPEVVVDVVELDPLATELARRFFTYGMHEYPHITVFHEDARTFINRGGHTYDVVVLDAFSNFLSIPWPLVTKEALAGTAAIMSARGVVIANVISPVNGPASEFLRRLLKTMEDVFEIVRVYRLHFNRPAGALQTVLVVGARSEQALPSVDWPQADVSAKGPVLTDRFAPVEYLQARFFRVGVQSR